ncbi:OLC1v1002527C1 [Oldenlandia corymbosa var. corymbosa]|uniref:OLC1v1002527C1 n=1 Tax=Oldenlandia corymbosa var. corymbosa TaxID=529605 RepID=A0AAV1D7U5_OLDCO|nr:OLC1v1002527C1 [Oldenlandia corymbosa var. corymbosa]
MTRLASQKQKTQMVSRLSEPEVDAALQLIQLSGESSACSAPSHNNNDNGGFEDKGDEDSVEISSAMRNTMIEDENLDDEACPPRNRKFRSILDIYTETKPLSPNNDKKKNKAAAAGKNKKARLV